MYVSGLKSAGFNFIRLWTALLYLWISLIYSSANAGNILEYTTFDIKVSYICKFLSIIDVMNCSKLAHLLSLYVE